MANDKQVKKELVPFGAKFLPEEIANIDGSAEVYSLENEYAKTKKNKNWMVLFIVFVFIGLIAALTVFVTYYSKAKDSNIEVSINEFEDLRLKEILNSSRLTENNLQIGKNEVVSLMVEMRNKILQINNIYLKRQNAVLDKGAPEETTRSRLAELRRAEDAEVRAVRAKYEGRINKKRAIINEIEREKAKADREVRKENKAIGSLGDENRLYAQNMKRLSQSSRSGLNALTDFYERYIKYVILKYNPVFKPGDVKTTLARNAKRNEEQNLREYDELFAKENIISRQRFDETRGKIKDRSLLMDRLIGVEYENSVPPALNSIDNLSNSIVNDYENLWFGLASTVKQKNSQIEDYRIALDAVLKERPESGYIISAVNPSRISIHINRLLTVQEGDIALVFRTDDLYIGKIKFYRTAEGLKARLVSLAGKEKMRPFDRILIKIK
ncbi:MAG TPA: hypothetical protein PK358_03730 [Spirochaetota bacterium]|nr:hypothetical protein [Spirochaetota bacterium]HPJ33917.1 hypothetical protein [Spirochaetota bacterium]